MSTAAKDKPTPHGKLGEQTKGTMDMATESVKGGWQSLGNETRKTIIYAGAALACLAVTLIIEFASRPAEIAEYGKVGQEFFPGFTDPTLATALNLAMIDKDQVEAKEFSVEQMENGQWVIPSHHHYPADAEDQLAKTATSVIGIKRGAMVTRWNADHARFGVVNPKVDSLGVDQFDGVGQRLTLRGEDESILADYIIGNQVEGESDQYYVRHPDEDEVYVATLNIDLSTKFTDWIESDLLDINISNVVHVALNDYQFDELKGIVTQRDVTTLDRKSSTDDWKMDGLDSDSQEVDKDAIRDTINAIASLEVSGVRPKQKGLTADLKLDQSTLGSQRDVQRLQSDLLSRGFLLQPTEDGDSDSLKLISREGELTTAINDGLVFNMYFGRVFTGSQEELEIGFGSNDEDAEAASAAAAANAVNDAEDEKSEQSEKSEDSSESSENESDTEDAGKDSGKPGRYVFVTVGFDKQFVGDQTDKPTEPEMPAELKEAASDTSDSSQNGSKEDSEQATDENTDATAEETDEQEEKEETEEERLERIRNEYTAKQEDYEADLNKWESFQEQIIQGQQQAEDLNRRFAQWYYVIPGEDYDKLALTRSDLVKEKEKEADAESEATKAGVGEGESPAKEEKAVAESDSDVEKDASTQPAKVDSEGGVDSPDTSDEKSDKVEKSADEGDRPESDSSPPANDSESRDEPGKGDSGDDSDRPESDSPPPADDSETEEPATGDSDETQE